MTKYNVGIIGCGDIGFLFDHKKRIEGALTHFRAFENSRHFNVKAVSEKRINIGKNIEKNHKLPAYTDYRKMLNENEFDVISVATNDESHAEILNELIKYKPKLVFCEKPLAMNSADVKETVKLFKKNKIHLQVNYTRRFLDEFSEIGNSIKSGKLGDIESATFYYSRGLIHNASHYLDLVNWYFGENKNYIVKISEKEGLSKGDSTVSFNMTYKNGTEVRFIGLNPTKLSFAEIDLVGTKGRIRVNYKNEIEKYKVTENKIYNGYKIYKLTECKPVRFSSALPNAVDNIYKTLEGKEELDSPAENSLKIFELINRIKERPICRI